MEKFKYVYERRREKFQEFYEKDWLYKEPLETAVVAEGYILPPKSEGFEEWQRGLSKPTMGNGGVVDRDGNYVNYSACRAEHLIDISALTRDRFGGKYSFDKKQATFRNETVIYCGIFWEQWGHFLIDQITRLWYVIRENQSEHRLIWLTTGKESNPIKGNFLHFIKLLQIDINRIEFINNVTQFREIIVPQPAYYAGRYYTGEYNQLINVAIKNALNQYQGEIYKKIYFSRVKFSKNSLMEIGEKSIETVFRKNGYTIIYPEKLDVVTQVALINQCEVMVSLEGTIAHNSLFMAEKNMHIVINRNRIINPFQFQIDSMRKLETVFIDAWAEPFGLISKKNAPGAFWKDPSYITVNKLMKLYLRDSNLCLPIIANNFIIRTGNIIKLIRAYFNIIFIRRWKRKLYSLMQLIKKEQVYEK